MNYVLVKDTFKGAEIVQFHRTLKSLKKAKKYMKDTFGWKLVVYKITKL